jgi:cell division protein FtsB
MRLLSTVFLVTLVTLQVRLWVGDGSLAEVWRIERDIDRQTVENTALAERNNRMSAEVRDLKTGLATVEALARRQLGLIGPGETFFLIAD